MLISARGTRVSFCSLLFFVAAKKELKKEFWQFSHCFRVRPSALSSLVLRENFRMFSIIPYSRYRYIRIYLSVKRRRRRRQK